MKSSKKDSPWVVKPLVPEEVYTDRAEFLDWFYGAALKAVARRTSSTVLLGQRRMGKTEIFKRVVNRLFFEQDPGASDVAIPVYFSFPEGPVGQRDFAKLYLENYIRFYVGFLTRQPSLVTEELEGHNLISAVEASRRLYRFTGTLDLILTKYESVCGGDSTLPHKTALETPRRVADIDDSTSVVFLDEFQNTRLPQYDFDMAGFMQEAVESPNCPHFVTGSAMSILAREIIGRGALFGRFRSREIRALTEYHGAELASRAARFYGVEIPETMAPAVALRCGGNPFYIVALIQQAAERNQAVENEQVLNQLLAVDISSGFIWGELLDQVNRWIRRINGYGITKWVLYLSALDENTEDEKGGRLNVEKIRDEIVARERKEVSLDAVREVLALLSRGDLIEYLELGEWFRRVKDPIMLEFLRVWGRVEVEGRSARSVRQELTEKYHLLQRRVREYKGYLAEVYMSQVLWNSQKKILPGRFFNCPDDVKMPDMFVYVEHRHRPGAGKDREIDVLGAAGAEQWVCQSKWTQGRSTGTGVLKKLLEQRRVLMDGEERRTVRLWLFAHDGLSRDAEVYARENEIFWSAREQLDGLLEFVGLRKLPDLDESVS